ncbi:MAG: putative ABC transport system ATP-binding protein [Candidatus Saccharimonadales bacterium]|jgi:putative ABC transport system ATP-binding protein
MVMIELKNVSKVFGKKQNVFTALQDITLDIEEGQTVSITGKSGSGKSTLMHVMSGLDHVSDGSIEINGSNLKDMKRKAVDKFRASEMSFIFQAFFVEANQTCLDNVMLPLEIAKVPAAKRLKMAKSALAAVDMTDKLKEKGRNLSGGQKQRLAIARAIVNKPSLIFADEPTGNLDSATGDLVTELLFDLNKKLGATLVIVTHDEELAKKCNQQIILKDGKLVSSNIKVPTTKGAKK